MQNQHVALHPLDAVNHEVSDRTNLHGEPASISEISKIHSLQRSQGGVQQRGKTDVQRRMEVRALQNVKQQLRPPRYFKLVIWLSRENLVGNVVHRPNDSSNHFRRDPERSTATWREARGFDGRTVDTDREFAAVSPSTIRRPPMFGNTASTPTLDKEERTAQTGRVDMNSLRQDRAKAMER